MCTGQWSPRSTSLLVKHCNVEVDLVNKPLWPSLSHVFMLPHYGDQNSYSGHCRFLLRLPQALNKASRGSEPLLTCEAINKNPGRTAVSCVIWGERPALSLRCWGWHLLWRNTKHMGRGWGAEAPRHTIVMPCQQRFLEKKQIQLQRPLWYHCDRIPRLNYCKKQWLRSFYYEIRQWIGMLNCEFTVIVWQR